MTEERPSVRSLAQKFTSLGQENQKNVYIPKPKGSSIPPQVNVQIEVDEQQNENDVETLRAIIQKQKYDLNKLQFELGDVKTQYNKIINNHQELTTQASRSQILSQRNAELEKECQDMKSRLFLANEKLEQQVAQQQQAQQVQQAQLKQQQQIPKNHIQTQTIPIPDEQATLNSLREQNRLLIERLQEKPDPKGKELIIVNAQQAIQLKVRMEELKLSLITQLNHYSELIVSKQHHVVKNEISSDVKTFHTKYMDMFKGINRPIDNVDQIGKILSPVHQAELNEFLVILSEFLNKFTMVI